MLEAEMALLNPGREESATLEGILDGSPDGCLQKTDFDTILVHLSNYSFVTQIGLVGINQTSPTRLFSSFFTPKPALTSFQLAPGVCRRVLGTWVRWTACQRSVGTSTTLTRCRRDSRTRHCATHWPLKSSWLLTWKTQRWMSVK